MVAGVSIKKIGGIFGAFSEWRPFPDPRYGALLEAPFGQGCYELRRADTGALVLCGSSAHVCWRITSLLPPPFGQGTRINVEKRQYVWDNLCRIEYRTMACASVEDAKAEEVRLHAKNQYVFPT